MLFLLRLQCSIASQFIYMSGETFSVIYSVFLAVFLASGSDTKVGGRNRMILMITSPVIII